MATIETESLLDGREDVERVVDLLTSEFVSVAYCIELREQELSTPLFEESSGREYVTFH
jgi:hypothetical protein